MLSRVALEETIGNLVLKGKKRLFLSYVAEQGKASYQEARTACEQLSKEGKLEKFYEIICPDSARTIHSLKQGKRFPGSDKVVSEAEDLIGTIFICESCDLPHKIFVQSVLLYTYSGYT